MTKRKRSGNGAHVEARDARTGGRAWKIRPTAKMDVGATLSRRMVSVPSPLSATTSTFVALPHAEISGRLATASKDQMRGTGSEELTSRIVAPSVQAQFVMPGAPEVVLLAVRAKVKEVVVGVEAIVQP